MTNEIILEVIKTLMIAGAGGIVKLLSDVRILRRDLDAAFCKIRTLETENGAVATAPGTEAPK